VGALHVIDGGGEGWEEVFGAGGREIKTLLGSTVGVTDLEGATASSVFVWASDGCYVWEWKGVDGDCVSWDGGLTGGDGSVVTSVGAGPARGQTVIGDVTAARKGGGIVSGWKGEFESCWD
jgi:hypothetical protein